MRKQGKYSAKKKKKIWGIFLLRNQQEFPASDSITKLHGQFCQSSIKHSIDFLVSVVRARSKINLDSWPMSSEQEMTTKKERKCQMFNPLTNVFIMAAKLQHEFQIFLIKTVYSFLKINSSFMQVIDFSPALQKIPLRNILNYRREFSKILAQIDQVLQIYQFYI